MGLVTVDQLDAMLAGDKQQAVDMASALVEGWCPGLTFSPSYGNQASMWLSGQTCATMPVTPVIRVCGARLDGTKVAVTASGSQVCLPSPSYGLLEVEYDAGYETVPADVQAVVLRVAASIASNPQGYTSETIGQYSYSRDRSLAATLLSDGDKAVLERYCPGGRSGGRNGGLVSVPLESTNAVASSSNGGYGNYALDGSWNYDGDGWFRR